MPCRSARQGRPGLGAGGGALGRGVCSLVGVAGKPGKAGTASILLAFLAAVSFRGMRAPLAASAAPMGENASLIAPTTASPTITMATAVAVSGVEGTAMRLRGGGIRTAAYQEATSVEQQQQQTGDNWSERPDTATLTKGFSIPTYLPPFPDFIPADLPQIQRNASAWSRSPTDGRLMPSNEHPPQSQSPAQGQSSQSQSQSQSQPRLHAYDSEQKELQLRREKELAKEREQLPRRPLSLPPMNATVQAGQHAYLPCKLNQHSNKPLSWVRLRDEHIIAVDHTTFINDARFASLLQSTTSPGPAPDPAPAPATDPSMTTTPTAIMVIPANASSPEDRGNGSSLSWTLQIKYVRLEDAGWYECQLATEPKMSAKVQLFVITPRTELIGDRQRFVKAGSKVELHCIVRGTLEAPKYIFWYRGEQQVTAENEVSGAQSGWYTQIDRNIFGSTEHNRNTIGSLVIPLVRKIHSGNYTCEPENSAAVSMQLHVLSGEYSASAIKSAAAGLHRLGHGYSSLHQWLIFLLVALNKT
ncbi:uncharacterized protein LOC108157494 [Drosophila miranda]|uniref:uncharacterized protein LOC108157494 n=1 Tax=Drosophila miranda TaxID=7229 RepID=UPI0007E773B2|nr:uncharacterized protein LOC108157494 [Drosophila miranda]